MFLFQLGFSSRTDVGEKPTKYFLNLESSNFTSKVIIKIIDTNYVEYVNTHEIINQQRKYYKPLCSETFTGPDSLVVRASASGSEGRGFAPWPRNTKGVKNGTGSSFTDARNERVVLGRYKNAGRYLLLVMSQ